MLVGYSPGPAAAESEPQRFWLADTREGLSLNIAD
jgi:hypothetical protein